MLKVKKINCIKVVSIKSLTNLFDVEKRDYNLRMVHNCTYLDINDELWDPHLLLSTAETIPHGNFKG